MKKILIGLSVIITLALAGVVYANSSYFQRSTGAMVNSTTATTSVTYIVRGTSTATTTLVFDTALYETAGIGDSAELFIQFTASSTGSILDIQHEYSIDGIDWYGTATSSATVATNPFTQWQFASSSVTYGTGVNNRVLKVFEVPILARYVRTLIYLDPASGSHRGAIWAELVAKKERNF